ncbi:MAG: hypothetical protein R2712_11425 [Vicinamibacterales bacterium]
MRPRRRARAGGGTGGHDVEQRSAFSLLSSQVFTTRESAFYLTFRRVQSLDVRVYRVRDAVAFFGKLVTRAPVRATTSLTRWRRMVVDRTADGLEAAAALRAPQRGACAADS